MTTATRKNRILRDAHETAQGLHGAGLISKRRMGEFDALCHLGVAAMSPQEIRRLRQKARFS